MGQYIYSVIECNEERIFDAVPIGSMKQEAGNTKQDNHASCVVPHASSVYTICHDGLAAVVSDSEVREYPLTRENMLAHQKVNEVVMKEFVVLPVKFCTIAENPELIVGRLLDAKRDELESKLEYLNGKNEFGLKVIWREMSDVFSAIVEENREIKGFKMELERMDPARARDGLIEIGHMVKDALDAKKEAVGGVVYERLAGLAVESKKNEPYGDRMLLNAVFLVKNSKEEDLSVEINKLAQENVSTMDWRYVGPTPAANFVEIVVTWEEGGKETRKQGNKEARR